MYASGYLFYKIIYQIYKHQNQNRFPVAIRFNHKAASHVYIQLPGLTSFPFFLHHNAGAKCTQLHISTATVEVNLEVGILRFIPARKHFATDFSKNKYMENTP